MLIVIARLGTPETVGRFALAVAISAPVILFASLNLRIVQATDTSADCRFSHYFTLRLLLLGMAVAVILVGAQVGGAAAGSFPLLALVTATKVFDWISDVIYGELQRQERLNRIAVSRIIQGTLQLGALAITLALTRNLLWAVGAMALVSGMVTATYDAASVRSFVSPGVFWRECREIVATLVTAPRKSPLLPLVWLALPMGFVALLDQLLVNVPRYFIQVHCGTEALGYFAAIASLMLVGAFLVGAVADTLRPRLAQSYATDRRTFVNLLGKMLGIGVVLAAAPIIVAMAWGSQLLALVFGPEYAGQQQLFFSLMCAAGAWYLAGFLYTAATAARKFAIQAPLLLITAGATAAACFIMVPKQGIAAAGWAFCIGMMVRLVGSLLVVIHVLRAR